jgi:hypothetical protein
MFVLAHYKHALPYIAGTLLVLAVSLSRRLVSAIVTTMPLAGSVMNVDLGTGVSPTAGNVRSVQPEQK